MATLLHWQTSQAYQSYGIASSGNPPNLPVRYSPNPTSRQEDEPAYLEPVEAGLKYRYAFKISSKRYFF